MGGECVDRRRFGIISLGGASMVVVRAKVFWTLNSDFATILSFTLGLLLFSPVCIGDEIRGSVGMGGKNGEADVLTVQVLLNQVPGELGGPSELLDPDGEIGPATISAISAFQRKHFAQSDSRIDPNGQSLVKLNQIVEEQSFASRVSQVALGEAKFWKGGGRKEVDA